MRQTTHNLIRRLRDLPAAPIPEGLEDRLRGAIPRSERWRRRGWIAGIAASVAAAAVLGIALVAVRPPAGRVQVLQKEVSPQFVLKIEPTQRQETQPCYVLPLLPES